MHVPIRRRDGVTHDELVRHWRQVHMPAVMAHMTPRKYAVTIFDQRHDPPFDGMATVTYDDLSVARREQVTDMPAGVAGDGFGKLIRRSDRLECTEHIIVNGRAHPSCHKVVGLARMADGQALVHARRAWLETHAPNVAAGFEAAGGMRYVVSLADRHHEEPAFVGVAELWYRDRAAARAHLAAVAHDPFLDLTVPLLLHGTEHLGIG